MAEPRTSLFARLAAGAVMLLAVVTLAAVALHGWGMYVLSLDTQGQATTAIADFGASQLSTAVDARARHRSVEEMLQEAFDEWGSAALRQPRVLLVALLDADQRVLRCKPSDVRPPGLAPSGEPGGGVGLCRLDPLGGGPREVWVATRGVGDTAAAAPLAHVMVVADKPPLTIAWATWSLLFGLPLGGIACLAFVIAMRWLHLRVRVPLERLVRPPTENTVTWLAQLPTDSPDEVGCIARETGDLLTELHDLQSELDHLRRTLDSRVAARTRRITTQLGDAQRKAWMDPLTGLGNRRLLEHRLEELFEAGRNGGGLALVMFDVDNFKVLNDTQGHTAGDQLLQFFGHLLAASIREGDLPIRYGGDEFVALLPGVTLDQAAGLAQRIVRSFGQRTAALPVTPPPTLSAGVVSSRGSGALSGAELLKLADAALYRAKGRGKNGVYAAGHEADLAPAPMPAIRPA